MATTLRAPSSASSTPSVGLPFRCPGALRVPEDDSVIIACHCNTMGTGTTAILLAKRMLMYYSMSWCVTLWEQLFQTQLSRRAWRCCGSRVLGAGMCMCSNHCTTACRLRIETPKPGDKMLQLHPHLWPPLPHRMACGCMWGSSLVRGRWVGVGRILAVGSSRP